LLLDRDAQSLVLRATERTADKVRLIAMREVAAYGAPCVDAAGLIAAVRGRSIKDAG
jgi:hypothetical protein